MDGLAFLDRSWWHFDLLTGCGIESNFVARGSAGTLARYHLTSVGGPPHRAPYWTISCRSRRSSDELQLP